MKSLGCGASAADYYEDDDAKSREDYYTGSREGPGHWWAPTWEIVQHGGIIEKPDFAALCAGFDPGTGEGLTQRTGDRHRAGLDCVFSAPKSVSALWAAATVAGDENTRQAILAAQSAAVEKALQFCVAEGLFQTRTGQDGVNLVSVNDVVVARYQHHTSRAGDPLIHDHAVILNLTRGPDGETRTMEPAELFRWNGAIMAAYRAELASELTARLGVAVEKVARNFEILGVSEALIKTFSKRRQKILELAADQGITTAEARSQASKIARDSRDRKDRVPDRETLEARWKREIDAHGTSGSLLVETAIAIGRRSAEAEQAPHHPGLAAIAEATEQDAVIDSSNLHRLVLEHGQGRLDIDGARREIADLEASGAMVQIGCDERNKPVYSTPEAIEMTRQMLLDAIERQGEPSRIGPAMLTAAIAARPTMRGEQQVAARHVLTGGVVLTEGDSGTGKSWAGGAIAEAARASGSTVWAVAPMWAAAEKLRDKTAAERTMPSQGLAAGLRAGNITLRGTDLILLDEIGMCGLRDLSTILRAARQAGAQVVGMGDRKQLEAIEGGGAMAALVDELGAARLKDIGRQKVDWQRDASMAIADGRASEALRTYDAHGRVVWSDSREAAITAIVEQWDAWGRDHPGEARIAIAPRHIDVAEVNTVLRTLARKSGGLAGDDVVIIARHRDGEERDLALAIGDRVVFGEVADRLPINTSDLATVREIQPDPGGDHKLILDLDKGVRVEARLSQLLSAARIREWAESGDVDIPAPSLQHAYCATTHVLQGDTKARAIFFNSRGADRRQFYVGMTRHEMDAVMVVDCDRVRARIEESASFGERPDLSLDKVKAIVGREIDKYRAKRSVRDYVADVKGWLATGRIVLASATEATAADPLTAAAALADRMARRHAAPPEQQRPQEDHYGKPANPRAFDGRFGPAQPYPESAAGGAVAESVHSVRALPGLSVARHDDVPGVLLPSDEGYLLALEDAQSADALRWAGDDGRVETADDLPYSIDPGDDPDAWRRDLEAVPAEPRQPEPERHQFTRRRSTPAVDSRELDRFGTEINLQRYLEDRGYQAVDGKLSYGLRMVRGQWSKGRDGKVRADDQVIVKHDANTGRWVYSDPKSGGDRGGIVRYVQTRDGGTLGEVRKALRPYLRDGGEVQSSARERQQEQLQRKAGPDPERLASIADARRRFAAMPAIRADYLGKRGLDASLPTQFPDDIRAAAGVLAFAHRDQAGQITGFEIKGESKGAKVARFSKGGERGLFVLGELASADKIVLCEAGLDALSRRQLDGSPANVAYVSTGGRPSGASRDIIADLARTRPDVGIEIAFDRDAGGIMATVDMAKALLTVRDAVPGAGLADYLRQMETRAAALARTLPELAEDEGRTISAAQSARAQIAGIELPAGVSIAVPGQGKDWNDQVRGCGWTPATAATEADRRAAEEAAQLAMEMDCHLPSM